MLGSKRHRVSFINLLTSCILFIIRSVLVVLIHCFERFPDKPLLSHHCVDSISVESRPQKLRERLRLVIEPTSTEAIGLDKCFHQHRGSNNKRHRVMVFYVFKLPCYTCICMDVRTFVFGGILVDLSVKFSF